MSEGKPGKRKQRSELKSLLLLIILSLEGQIGRYRLKSLLGLSEHEGVVRLMLNELGLEGYVEARKAGCGLTSKGEAFLQALLRGYGIIRVKDMDLKALGLEGECFVLHIRGRRVPRRIIELRDAAVRAGADGVVLIDNEEGRLKIPAVYDDLDLEHPAAAKKLRETFAVSLGDMFLVGFSKNRWRALEGALAAAMELK